MNSKYKVLKFNSSKFENVEDLVSIEEPLEISLKFKEQDKWITQKLSITMRTPGNDEDLVRGFLFNEQIIQNIKDMGYQCKSCVYCQASVSLLSRKIKNKKVNEIKDFVTNGEKLFEDVKVTMQKHWKDFKVILDKKNLARKECLLLPLRTILKALKI